MLDLFRPLWDSPNLLMSGCHLTRPTQSSILTVDIIVGKDCSLNTIISVKLQLEGGADNLGRIISKEISAVLMVGERRSVTLQTSEAR